MIRLDEALIEAKVKGLNGLALTEHEAPSKVRGFMRGVLIIPGLEVNTPIGHVLVLGADQWRLKPGLKHIQIVLEEAKRLGAVTVLAHPFPRTLIPSFTLQIRQSGLDAIEALNSGTILFPISSRVNIIVSLKFNIPMTAGSDSHIPRTIGYAYTVVETSSTGMEDILESIRKGLTEVYGKPSGLKAKLEKKIHGKKFEQFSPL
ncbi:PHP domain-containing protein [Candidatus Bathyarchaeota archaeon]|nr:PHP domain-containing protein [Candidatus Bathyarchaeota archaeon]MBS7612661.1 PHP domain-containing protein [Candidatus Bathyarchaeota archaeon]MBS7617835.1 PHP domain-containing protein [Candidatus Bathyarchaeota archaeon]